jgi:hypothetical protein
VGDGRQRQPEVAERLMQEVEDQPLHTT